MVKPVAKAEISSFVKGLITETSPLNSVADSCRDIENYELNNNGSVERRIGLDFEIDYSLITTNLSSEQIKDAGITSFTWYGAGGVADNEFGVVQIGGRIHIFDTAKESVSTDGYKGYVDLSVTDITKVLSFASVDGVLVIGAGTDVIHIVKYTDATNTFAYTTDRILIRDIWGLPGNDGNDINLRPSVKTDAHIYNLFNQGWGVPRKNSAGTLADPIATFYAQYTKYPANSEVVYTGLQYQPVTSGTPFERIYPAFYDDQMGLDDKAGRGYFIIDALRRGTSRLTEFNNNKTKFPALTQTITTLPADTTSGGCSLVADFAGRIFFGGFDGEVTGGDANSPNLASYLFFSQRVKNTSDIVKCYQSGDPTSREKSEVIDTDGGLVRISGIKKMLGIVAQSNCLLIIGENGVWTLQGGSDYGFTATNYSITKLSAYGCNSQKSIVVVNDVVYFWGSEGIFVISKNQYGDWGVTNISEKTVQTLYDSIENLDKVNARGIFDSYDKKIRWMYNQDSDLSNQNAVRELVLNTGLGSFSKNRFGTLVTTTPNIVGFFQTSPFLSGESVDIVTVEDVVIQVDGEDVVINTTVRSSGIQSVKYIVLYGTSAGKVTFTFAQYRDGSFRDWRSADGIGVDAAGYILTGQVTAGDSSIMKQTPYLTMHMLRTESGIVSTPTGYIPDNPSGCLLRTQWDWSNSVVSGKWSPAMQVYRYRRPYFIQSTDDEFDNGYETVVTKNKLRGRGRAVSLYFTTEPDKDCRILGWNLGITGNSIT